MFMSFWSPELLNLSAPEMNETCQLLDNFLDNLNYPLLSTIKIGHGKYSGHTAHVEWAYSVEF